MTKPFLERPSLHRPTEGRSSTPLLPEERLRGRPHTPRTRSPVEYESFQDKDTTKYGETGNTRANTTNSKEMKGYSTLDRGRDGAADEQYQDGETDQNVLSHDPLIDSRGSARPPFSARRSTFRSRSPTSNAKSDTRRRYAYASFFFVLSLVAFVLQTETGTYIQKDLKWNKAYCMLYITHGSWSLLWPITILVLRIQKRDLSWSAFWRRHIFLVRTTAQMTQSQSLYLNPKQAQKSPWPYLLKMVPVLAVCLTIGGYSWYYALDLTTPSDLTAIYNCSAFFAYAFSIPLLGDKFRWDKAISVVVAIGGVMIIAYGGAVSDETSQAKAQTKGNIIIGVGSVLYGLYEVLYKRLACPPDQCSPGRGMIFANVIGSMLGAATLLILWIPIPILHFTKTEEFEFPTGKTFWILLVSMLANLTFSGSFLVLMSLTSPVLSSVAALLTIFLVPFVEWAFLGKQAPGLAEYFGGGLIIGAFLLLAWSTYRETVDQRTKESENGETIPESDLEDND